LVKLKQVHCHALPRSSEISDCQAITSIIIERIEDLGYEFRYVNSVFSIIAEYTAWVGLGFGCEVNSEEIGGSMMAGGECSSSGRQAQTLSLCG
jgi:hypothetical protein